MVNVRSAVATVLCLFASAGCAASRTLPPKPEPEPAPDAGSQAPFDAGTGSPLDAAAGAGPAAACTLAAELSSCEELIRPLRLEVMLEASDLGPQAELLAAGGEWVLARGTDMGELLVHVPTRAMAERRVYPLPAGYEAIDLSARHDQVFVLACSGEQCELFRARGDLSASELRAIPGSALPVTFRARGLVNRLVVVGTSYEPEACAFGDGLRCFSNGAWRTEIAGTPEIQLVDVVLGEPSVALTQGGDLLIRGSDDMQWTALTDFAGQTLHSLTASSDGAGVLIAGAHWLEIRPDGTRNECELGRSFTALHAASEDSSRLFAVTESHELINYVRSPGGSFCGRQMLPAEPVIDLSAATCGISENPRVLMRSALLGSRFCAFE